MAVMRGTCPARPILLDFIVLTSIWWRGDTNYKAEYLSYYTDKATVGDRRTGLWCPVGAIFFPL